VYSLKCANGKFDYYKGTLMLSMFDAVDGDGVGTRRACYMFDDKHYGSYGHHERPYVTLAPQPLAARLTGSAIRRPFASKIVV
jgi:hypothetical protein